MLTYAEQQNEARFSREDIYLNGIYKVGSVDDKVTFGRLRYLILFCIVRHLFVYSNTVPYFLYHAHLERSNTL